MSLRALVCIYLIYLNELVFYFYFVNIVPSQSKKIDLVEYSKLGKLFAQTTLQSLSK